MGIKAGLGACALAGAIAVWGAPAGAAGPPVERFDGVYATCDGLGDVFIVTLPSTGDLTPGFVLDTGQVLVPVSVQQTVTFTPTGGTPQVTTGTAVRRAPKKATITTCTADGHFDAPDGTYEIHLEAQVVVRP